MDNKLKKVMDWVKSFSRDDEAQGMVEYGMILALISIVAVGALGVVGEKVDSAFDSVNHSLVGTFDQALAGTYHGEDDADQGESVSLFSATNEDVGERVNQREKNKGSNKNNEMSWKHRFNKHLNDDVSGEDNPNEMAWIVGGVIGVFVMLGFVWKLY